MVFHPEQVEFRVKREVLRVEFQNFKNKKIKIKIFKKKKKPFWLFFKFILVTKSLKEIFERIAHNCL